MTKIIVFVCRFLAVDRWRKKSFEQNFRRIVRAFIADKKWMLCHVTDQKKLDQEVVQ
jgi:hypothetical protein